MNRGGSSPSLDVKDDPLLAGVNHIFPKHKLCFKSNNQLKVEGLGGQLTDREISLWHAIQLLHLYFIKHEIMFIIVLDKCVRDISS